MLANSEYASWKKMPVTLSKVVFFGKPILPEISIFNINMALKKDPIFYSSIQIRLLFILCYSTNQNKMTEIDKIIHKYIIN